MKHARRNEGEQLDAVRVERHIGSIQQVTPAHAAYVCVLAPCTNYHHLGLNNHWSSNLNSRQSAEWRSYSRNTKPP